MQGQSVQHAGRELALMFGHVVALNVCVCVSVCVGVWLCVNICAQTVHLSICLWLHAVAHTHTHIGIGTHMESRLFFV